MATGFVKQSCSPPFFLLSLTNLMALLPDHKVYVSHDERMPLEVGKKERSACCKSVKRARAW
jgi:hypothetical protein